MRLTPRPSASSRNERVRRTSFSDRRRGPRLDIHADQLRLFGGSHGVRAPGALESAVATPASTFGGVYLHDGLFEMAAAYAFHIAENQPFVDGNKRTGLNAALVFLDINGRVVTDPEGQLYDAMIALSSRTLDKRGLGDIFRKLARPIDETF